MRAFEYNFIIGPGINDLTGMNDPKMISSGGADRKFEEDEEEVGLVGPGEDDEDEEDS